MKKIILAVILILALAIPVSGACSKKYALWLNEEISDVVKCAFIDPRVPPIQIGVFEDESECQAVQKSVMDECSVQAEKYSNIQCLGDNTMILYNKSVDLATEHIIYTMECTPEPREE